MNSGKAQGVPRHRWAPTISVQSPEAVRPLTTNIRFLWRRLDEQLDKGTFSGRWQRFKWTLKYILGNPSQVPDLDTLITRPHRAQLLDALDGLGEWRSALEVGCGRGANLYLLSRRHPQATLTGIDVSASVIKQTRLEFARRGLPTVNLHIADAMDLSAFPSGGFDVVFSDAVHMYVPPASIVAALRETLRISRLGAVISTWHENAAADKQPWRYDEGTWVYDYQRLFMENFGLAVELMPYSADAWGDARWRRYGCLLRVRFSDSGQGRGYAGPPPNTTTKTART